MRIKNVMRNTAWELTYEFIVVLLGFLAPRYIILTYGSEVNGLQSTIMQIIAIMTLLQAGAITASVYSLYKPVAENNFSEISLKLSASVRYFKKISYIFLVLVIIGAVVTSLLLQSGIDKGLIFVAFIIFGAKNALDLLFTSRFRILFNANQQKHIVSVALLIEQMIYYTLLFITLWLKLHFIYMYLWLLLGCMIKIIFMQGVFKNQYGNLITTSKNEVEPVIRGKNYALINEVSHSVVASSITILFSFLYGLEAASVLGVYWMVIRLLTMLAQALYASFAPSFGNLVAEGDYNKINRVFEVFQYVFFMLNTFLYMCAAYMILPFIRIYTNGITDAQYINQLLSISIIVYGIIYTYRIPYNIIISTNGLFKETWLQPLISAVISLFASIVLGRINMAFILIGPMIFYLTNAIYQHYVIRKTLPLLKTNRAINHIFVSVIGICIAIIVSVFVPSSANAIITWIIDAVGSALISILLIAILSLIFDRKTFFDTFRYIKALTGR
jgi:O-antigen/teichoic acid export membrane protein